MKNGDIVRCTKLDAKSGKCTFGFKVKNRKQRFVLLMLGVEGEEGELNPDKALNQMGWHFDPDRNDDQIAEEN